jgi:hypothetical protein
MAAQDIGNADKDTAITRTITISPDVVFERVGDEIVLLEIAEGKYFSLNSIGSHIWELLVKTGDARAVLDQVHEEYDISYESLTRDFERFLGELGEKGLVSKVPRESKAAD